MTKQHGSIALIRCRERTDQDLQRLIVELILGGIMELCVELHHAAVELSDEQQTIHAIYVGLSQEAQVMDQQ